MNNLLAGINLAGAAEAMAMAQRMGLDLGRTLDVIEQSSGQSWIGSDRMRRAIAGDYEPRAHVTLLQKDTRLAVEAAAAAGFTGRWVPAPAMSSPGPPRRAWPTGRRGTVQAAVAATGLDGLPARAPQPPCSVAVRNAARAGKHA